jgi:glycosyltransferase involved in cell wall biosynthesis
LRYCWSVSTFKKNLALDRWLDTFAQFHDVESLSHFVITDDDFPTARPIYEKFKPILGDKLAYIGGCRKGIARNKNRGIRYFLEKTEDEILILCDDDIQWCGKGIEQAFLGSNWAHILGYWGAPELEDFRDIPYFATDHPIFAETKDLMFSSGAQGVMMFAGRNVIDPNNGGIGYFDLPPGMYGYEHSLYSNRINRKFGYHPDYFAFLKDCERFYIPQSVPNDYEPDFVLDKRGNKILDSAGQPILVNREWWFKRRQEIFDGWSLVKKDHGLGDEVCR